MGWGWPLSRSGLCGPSQSSHAVGTLPAVPPGTGSAARPGEVRTRRGPPEACGPANVRGCCGPSALPAISVAIGAAASRAQHGAQVLLVPPGFSWNPSAQRDKFGPGLVYSSSAINACLILNEGKCKELTSCLYNKFAVE